MEEKSSGRNSVLYEEWKRLLSEWEDSGQSGAAWSRLKQIPYHRFIYWKKRLLGVGGDNTAGAFVELSGSSPIRIEMNGISVNVEGDFDPYLLSKVIRTLRST